MHSRQLNCRLADYILKPITQEAINDILNKITNNIKVLTMQQEKRLLKDLLNLGENVDISSIKLNCDYFISALFVLVPIRVTYLTMQIPSISFGQR